MVLNIRTTATGYQCNYGPNKEATVVIEVDGLRRKVLQYYFSEPNPIRPSKEINFKGTSERLGNISIGAAKKCALEGLMKQVDSLLGHEEEFLTAD